jgi:thiamine pyrophosphokinase
MNLLKRKYSSEFNLDVIILGSVGGRVDQGIGLLHELYRETKKNPPSSLGVRLWMVSESSVSFVLRPGKNRIEDVAPRFGVFRKKIGILPIYGPATITTEGLEWDVKRWKTEMGGMVSTSNHVVADTVIVETDHYVLFTIERARKAEDKTK